MRILIISRYFPPYPSIASQRPWSWAKYWSRMGHEISVLTWDGGESRRYNLAIGDRLVEIINVRNEVYASFQKYTSNIISSKLPLSESNEEQSNPSLLSLLIRWIAKRQHDCRMPHVHDFWKKYALRAIKGERWDLVVSTYAPPVTHDIGCALKKGGATRFWIADYRDLWLEHHVARGLFPFTLIEKYLEASYVRNVDLLTTVSDPLANILRTKFPDKIVEVITNGCDMEELQNLPAEIIFAAKKVCLVYTGTIYTGKQNPSPLFAAVRQVADMYGSELLTDFEIVFAGSDKEYIEKKARNYNISQWVRHVGVIPRIDSLRMQRDAYALIFLDWDDTEVDGILTGKFFEYVASGTEIWSIGGVKESSVGLLLHRIGAGQVFGCDIESIAKSLFSLLNTRQKIKLSCDLDYLKQFDRKFIAERMLEYTFLHE